MAIMEERIVAATMINCPRCGGKLELVEVDERLYFGCPRCLCYTFITAFEARRFFNRRAMRFNWRQMMRAMYSSYLDLVQSSSCRRRRR
jgi:phage FluMu protein Com